MWIPCVPVAGQPKQPGQDLMLRLTWCEERGGTVLRCKLLMDWPYGL